MAIWSETGLCTHFFQLALMNSLRESFPHCIRLPDSCYSVFGKSLTTDLTIAVHIFNTFDIGPRINLCCSTPKLFNFIELILVAFKIIAFKIISIFWGPAIFFFLIFTPIDGFFIFWNINLCGLLKAEDIHVEEQYNYSTNSWEKKGVHAFINRVCSKVYVTYQSE